MGESDFESSFAVPGYRNYLVFGDESGFHESASYYWFGTLWMPWERRGDFARKFTEAKTLDPQGSEMKWSKIRGHNWKAYRHLVKTFFETNWLMFHSLIVKRSDVNFDYHDAPDDHLKKHYTMLLSQKIKYFSDGAADKRYHVRLDKLPFAYKKSDVVAREIIRNTLRRDIGSTPLASLLERDSQETAGIQMADVLLGAVLAAWQGEVEAEPKKQVMATVAKYLGWKDLRADTRPEEAKFNIWRFYDPTLGPRQVTSRSLNLLIPMVVFRPPAKRRR